MRYADRLANVDDHRDCNRISIDNFSIKRSEIYALVVVSCRKMKSQPCGTLGSLMISFGRNGILDAKFASLRHFPRNG